jgi:two-component sensor histidine kinase
MSRISVQDSVGPSGSGVAARSTSSFLYRLIERVPPYSVRALFLALGCLAVATLLREAFGLFGADLKFAVYFPAVLLVALLAGPAAATVAIIGSMLTVWWAFLPPPFRGFGPLDTAQIANMAVFVLSSSFIAGLAQSYRQLHLRLAARERDRELIMQELEHRSRNTYAIIEAIVKKTMEDDPARAETITGRIRAVKFANDLINKSDTHTVLLKSMLFFEFAPYGESRADIGGKDIELQADTARPLALVFHEMVTNAAKYGSLSRPGGKVSLSWQQVGETVRLQWKEEGGPPVSKPLRNGFGSRLVTQSLKVVAGEIRPTFAPEGLRCEITFRARNGEAVPAVWPTSRPVS